MADYIETQIRLAAVLPAVGFPYEARSLAGEALCSAVALNVTWPDELRFWVLYANTAAAVGDLLAGSKDPEAAHYWQLAAALWKEAREKFPHAEDFVSSMRLAASDWDLFCSAHPALTSQPTARKAATLWSEPSAFKQRARGQTWYQFAAWEDAAKFFGQAAELHDNGQAYDWFYLAMTYHHLNQPAAAKQYYQRAAEQLQNIKTPDSELESLRREAAQLLERGEPSTLN